MGCQENGLTAFANPANKFPDCAAGLGIKPGGQFVEKHHLGIVDQRKGNKQPLLLAPRKIHEPGATLIREAKEIKKTLAVHCFLPVKRCPQVDRLPHLDSFLQLCLLELHSDALLQLVDLTKWIEAENRNDTAVGLAQPFDALHCGGFSCSVGSDQTEDLPFVD